MSKFNVGDKVWIDGQAWDQYGDIPGVVSSVHSPEEDDGGRVMYDVDVNSVYSVEEEDLRLDIVEEVVREKMTPEEELELEKIVDELGLFLCDKLAGVCRVMTGEK